MIAAASRDSAGETRVRLLGSREECDGSAKLDKAEPKQDQADQNNRHVQDYR
jgi:hypothetical protein